MEWIPDVTSTPDVIRVYCRMVIFGAQVKYGVRSPTFIWAPFAQLYLRLRLRNDASTKRPLPVLILPFKTSLNDFIPDNHEF